MKKDFKNILNKLNKKDSEKYDVLYLTANESLISSLVFEFQAGFWKERYVLGSVKDRKKKNLYFYEDDFLVQGFPVFDELEVLAQKACKKMFGCDYVDFSPLSGMHTMTALISSLTNPGDLVMTLSPNYGGHFATRSLLKKIGRKSIFLPFDEKKFEIDFKKLKELARNKKMKMVYLDAMCYIKPFNLKQIKKILPKSILVYDGSHVLGLIAGKQFQNPFLEGADILSGNTHKTLPGPQKGMIMFNDKKFKERMSTVSSVFTSSRHTNSSLALFVTLLEMEEFGKDYAKQIIKNSQALANKLYKNGFDLLSYPDIKPATHQIFICLDNKKQSVKLIKAGIMVNTVSIFNKQFIRLGTQQITRLGMKEKEMKQIADLIIKVLKENKINEAGKEVEKLTRKFKKVKYCFDC